MFQICSVTFKFQNAFESFVAFFSSLLRVLSLLRVSLHLISIGVGVIVITGLKFRFGAPYMMFGGATKCNRGFVYDSLFAAFSIERAIRLVAAVAKRDGGLWLVCFLRRFLLWLDKVVTVLGMQL